MPGSQHGPSIKNPKVYDALRRKGMSKRQAARISNAQMHKDAGIVAGAMLSGPGGLLATPGMGGRKWGNRSKDKRCTCGVVTKGEQIAPGITRIRGNLCNVHGRYGPCDESQSGKKPKGKKGRAPKAAKPKQTPEQHAQARAAQQATNRAAVDKQLGLPEDAAGALDDLRAGKPVDDDGGLVKLGLAEQAADGSYRLTPAGRALVAARNAGDAGRAHDIMSAARDRKGAQTERQQAQATRHAAAEQKKRDAEARRAAAAKKKPAGGGGGSKKKQPEQQAAQTSEQKRDAHRSQVRQEMADSDTGLAPAGFDALMNLAGGKEPDSQTADGLIGMGLAERGGDGTLRLTGPGRVTVNAANRGDTKAAVDAISRGQDQHAAQQQRETERSRRETARQARAEGLANEQQTRQQRTPRPAPAPRSRGAPIQTRGSANRGSVARRKRTNRGGRPMRVPQTTTKAGDPGDYLVVEDRTKPTTWHLQVKRNGKPDHGLMGSAWAALHSGFRGNKYDGPNKGEALSKLRALYKREKMPIPSEKSFVVFKDDTDAWRWLARTTTAYRDRDGEIITTKALEDDATRMTATKQYGPLRYWHIGTPDPFHPTAPWGVGLDIGECDYSIVIGRTSIESGTFKSAAVGRAFAESADDYEMSPGFFHPPAEPNVSGEYTTIRRFERSVVPIKYGRASNLFTGLTVKEHRMDQQTYDARVKAFLEDMNAKGVPEHAAAAALAGMQQADKSATAQGIAFKSEEPPTDPWQAVIAALKAAVAPEQIAEKAPAVMDAEDDPALGGDMGVDEEAEGEPPLDDTGSDGGEYIGDLTPAEFWDQLKGYLAELLAPQAKMEEMAKAFAAGLGEMKALYATKDASAADRLGAIEAKLAQLAGDVPASALISEAEAALKSDGPKAPADPNAVQIPDDPDRPIAPLAARLMPQLYGGGVQGYTNGWQIGQPIPPPNTGGN